MKKKIVLISDTHNNYPKLPEGDILIHAGDFSGRGSVKETVNFLRWFESQPHAVKIFISGNHDFLAYKDYHLFKSLVHDNIIYLQDELIEIEGIKIYGTPWTNIFYNWAFMGTPEEMKQRFDRIPDDTDILITHGPAYGILDQITPGKSSNLGSKELQDRLKQINPTLVVFGHIHGGFGHLNINGTIFANASICTEQYDPINPPIVLEIDFNK